MWVHFSFFDHSFTGHVLDLIYALCMCHVWLCLPVPDSLQAFAVSHINQMHPGTGWHCSPGGCCIFFFALQLVSLPGGAVTVFR
jgi:hypothetical protein